MILSCEPSAASPSGGEFCVQSCSVISKHQSQISLRSGHTGADKAQIQHAAGMSCAYYHLFWVQAQVGCKWVFQVQILFVLLDFRCLYRDSITRPG